MESHEADADVTVWQLLDSGTGRAPKATQEGIHDGCEHHRLEFGWRQCSAVTSRQAYVTVMDNHHRHLLEQNGESMAGMSR